MRSSVKEEELRDSEGPDDHYDGSGYDCEKADYVHAANDIEDNEARPGKAFRRKRHCFGTPLVQKAHC